MATTTTRVGPEMHGRRMSLDEFDRAEGAAGWLYELAQGGIVVVDVPGRRHLLTLNAARRQLAAYDLGNPGVVAAILGGGECKLLITARESECHPDLAVYRTPPPQEDLWSRWVPAVVVEVVSPGSEHRDYVEKRADYLEFGVPEYWVVDAAKQQVTVLARRDGQWAESVLGSNEVYLTEQLPGFELRVADLFAAGTA